MGTSSITRVIVDGEVKVNQYCQFDGEPTSRGIAVLGFVRSLQLEGRLEQMKNVLEGTALKQFAGTYVEIEKKYGLNAIAFCALSAL